MTITLNTIARRVGRADRLTAGRMDSQLRQIETRGVRASVQVGNRVRRAAVDAFITGRDAGPIIGRILDELKPVLLDAMVLADLNGQANTAERFRRQTRTSTRRNLAVRSPFEGALRNMTARIRASQDDLDALRSIYDAESVRVMDNMSRAVEREVLHAIGIATQRGFGRRKGARLVGAAIASQGIQPDASHSLEAIFRSETQKAYSAGRWNALMGNDIARDLLWGFRYVTATDLRVRPTHAVMHGITLPKEDPFWQQNYPPNGWNCRCQAIELFDDPGKVVHPRPVRVDGVEIEPQADQGWRVNHGQVFGPGPATPRRTSIKGKASDVLEFRGESELRVDAERTVRQIEKVHDVPFVQTTPVEFNPIDEKTLGYFRPLKFDKGQTGEIALNSGLPVPHPHPRMTMAHEFGHLLDYSMIGEPGTYASEHGGPVAKVMQRIELSNSVRQLRKKTANAAGKLKEHGEYLLRRREMFARAYAQHIAVKSANPVMIRELNKIRDKMDMFQQWSDSEFEPIAKAMDELLSSL